MVLIEFAYRAWIWAVVFTRVWSYFNNWAFWVFIVSDYSWLKLESAIPLVFRGLLEPALDELLTTFGDAPKLVLVPDFGLNEPPAPLAIGDEVSLCEELIEVVPFEANSLLTLLFVGLVKDPDIPLLVFIVLDLYTDAYGLVWIVLLIFYKALCLVSNSTLSSEMSSFLLTALYRSFIAWKKASIFLQRSISSAARSALS